MRRQRQLSLSSSSTVQSDTITNNSVINTTNSANNTTNSNSGGYNNTGTNIEQDGHAIAEDDDEEEAENEVEVEEEEEEEEDEYVLEGYQCMLCRGNIYKPTCTPCGHLYCWECLISLISSFSTLKLKPPTASTTLATLTTTSTTTTTTRTTGGSSSGGSSGGGGGKAGFGLAGSKDGYFYVKCPSCRHIFLPQQIRTLYHFQ